MCVAGGAQHRWFCSVDKGLNNRIGSGQALEKGDEGTMPTDGSGLRGGWTVVYP